MAEKKPQVQLDGSHISLSKSPCPIWIALFQSRGQEHLLYSLFLLLPGRTKGSKKNTRDLPWPLPQPVDESTQQSWHLVGPQQITVVTLLLLLKYLAKSKCRMRIMCVEYPKVLTHWSSWKVQGSSAYYFLKSVRLFRTEDSYEPPPQKGVYTYQFCISVQGLCGLAEAHHSWLLKKLWPTLEWSFALRPDRPMRKKVPALRGIWLYAYLLAMWSWTNYTSSLLLIVFKHKIGILPLFTHRIFKELKNETLLVFFFFLMPGTL